MATAIDSVERLSVADFHARYTSAEQPVVLRGAAREWAPFGKWTPEYLKAALGSTPVRVARSPDGGEYFDPESGVDHVRDFVLPFDQFIDRVFGGGGEKLYLLQASLEEFPQLAHDRVLPEHAGRPLLYNNLWIGSDGNVTRCHYDMQDNLLAQIVGRKRVTLFPSGYMRSMYPRSPFANKSNFSRVDVMRPDYARYPRFRAVPSYETYLEPGDLLYIPIHWFHHVVSLDASISLNYWWQARMSQTLRTAGLWYVPRLAANGTIRGEVAKLARRLTRSLLGRARGSEL